MSAPSFRRDHFSVDRAAEYFSVDELRAQTGAPALEFGHVILKELIDNALDAAETAGRAPVVDVRCLTTPTTILLSVADNGNGISDEIVASLLDFSTRTSDKSAYRSPTRGAQGNATKCAFGIPIALGASATRMTIEGAGSRHEITISVSVAGDLEIDHPPPRKGPAGGARITISFPNGCAWNPREWIEGFALFNPHARFTLTTFAQNSELPADWIRRGQSSDRLFSEAKQIEVLSFKPTGNPHKYSASDPTPAAWYSSEEIRRLAYLKARDYPATTVKDFVKSFKGASRKASEIAGSFPKLLKDADAKRLHAALLAATESPRPETLGRVGREHMRAALGGDRFRYAHIFGTAGGLPFLVECGIAEIVGGPQRRVFGMNFSTTLSQDPIRSESAVGWSGVSALLDRELSDAPIAFAFHLVMPRLPSLDRAKSRVGLPSAVTEAAVAVVRDAAKVLLKEAADRQLSQLKANEKREKQAAAERRRELAELRRAEAAEDRQYNRRLRIIESAERLARAEQLTKRKAVFSVLPEAYRLATDGERIHVMARDLFYAVRPLYELIDVKESRGGRDLDYKYFSKLLPEHRSAISELPLIDYKARGVLYLPHSGEEHPIGDRELRELVIPHWEFDKVLFIEKTGVWETLKQTGGIELCKRYDMAVVAGEGYASVAIRKLLAKLSGRGVKIYVWHDADGDGYDIARTLSEETARLPDHRLEIIDLGLTVADAIADGLQVERYPREKALSQALVERLTDQERDLFIGEKVEDGWIARRIEINAIPVKDRVAWLEKRRPEARPIGADPDAEIAFTRKVIPPADELAELAEAARTEALLEAITDEAYRQIRIEEIVERARDRLNVPPITDAEIRETLEENPEMSWSEAAAAKLPEADKIERAVTEIVAEMFGDINDGGSEEGDDE
jgi:hypothetical protein